MATVPGHGPAMMAATHPIVQLCRLRVALTKPRRRQKPQHRPRQLPQLSFLRQRQVVVSQRGRARPKLRLMASVPSVKPAACVAPAHGIGLALKTRPKPIAMRRSCWRVFAALRMDRSRNLHQRGICVSMAYRPMFKVRVRGYGHALARGVAPASAVPPLRKHRPGLTDHAASRRARRQRERPTSIFATAACQAPFTAMALGHGHARA